MKREDMINKLQQVAPFITEVTATFDMGHEFSAVVPAGVIYAMPGMLLGYSGGEWPPNTWAEKTPEEFQNMLRDFLLDEIWLITLWNDLSDEDLANWLEDVNNSYFYDSDEETLDIP